MIANMSKILYTYPLTNHLHSLMICNKVFIYINIFTYQKLTEVDFLCNFPVSALLIEFMILSIVNREDSYGYEISQTIKLVADIKESTLYPIL